MGGFLKGKRTYVTAVIAIISAVGAWAVGDADLGSTLNKVYEVALPLALLFLRASNTSS